MGTAASGNAGVGTIKVVTGDVKIIGVDGVARQAQVGDKVFAKETIQTNANAIVQVQLENGRMLDLGRDSKIALDDDVLNVGQGPSTAPAAAATTDIAALQAQIAAGADPSKVAEATAAGGAPGAGGTADGSGGTAVYVDQANSTGDVTSGYNTGIGGIGFPTLDPGVLPVISNTPVVSVSVSVQVQVQVDVGVSDGTGGTPTGGGGLPGDTDGDGVVVSGNVANLIEGTGPGSRTVNFIISLDKAFDTDVTVSYQIVAGTAQVGTDFNPLNGSLTGTVIIPAGQISFIVPVNIVQDSNIESNETFSIVLTGATNATINPAASTAQAVIFDDDIQALPDTNWAKEDSTNATGNVLQSLAHLGAPDGGARADAADLSTALATTSVATTGTFAGTYGTLTLNANGSYSYVLNNSLAAVQQLDDGEKLTETFSYTARNSFGGTSVSTLQITIFGTNDAPTINAQTNVRVSEEGLEGRTGFGNMDNVGNQDTTNSTFVSGTITVGDVDVEALTVVLHAPTTPLTSHGLTITWTGEGTGSLIGSVTTPLGGEGGFSTVPVITITINNSGQYSVNLLGPIDHQGANIEDDKSFNVVVTVSDGTASTNGTMTVTVEDDSPIITATQFRPFYVPTVDESNFAVDSTQNFSGVFSSNFGADGAAAANAKVYALGITATTDSGLIDSLTQQHVILSVSGGVVYGKTQTSGLEVFKITVDANGNVTLDQSRAIMHDSADVNGDISEGKDLAGLVTLKLTVTDYDGDQASATANIGSSLIFRDDGPSISVATTLGECGQSIPVTEPTLTVDETDLTTNASASFAGNFTGAYGADGAGTLTYALGTAGGASGLVDTATGEAVNLVMNAGVLEGRTATSNALVFTVSVSASGVVTLDQIRAVVHPTTNPDEGKSLSADNLITLTATITDKDGDTTNAVVNIGQNLTFKDDGPSISVNATAEPTLTVDETVLATNASADFSGNFTGAYGADGAGTLTYALGTAGGASGLVDTATGEAVNLVMNAGVLEGRTATSNALVFTVSVSASGVVTLDQIRAVVHPTTNPDEGKSLSADNLITLTATITDKDGDTTNAVVNIGQNLTFKDDGPSISVNATAEPTLTVDETVLATNASADFSGNFTGAYGADGAGTLTYALGTAGGASGLVDTATGEAVNLVMNAGVLEGRTATSNALVFTVSVSAGGVVTLDQIRAVVHPTTNPDEGKSLSADNLITLTATITDKDGDTTNAVVNIGQNLTFKDDGPSISVNATAEPTLTVDETVLATNASASFAGNFTSAYGADGAGTLTYALGTAGGASGLVDTATNEAVNLVMNAGVLEGRTATTNLLVFTVSVSAGGVVTLDQIRAVVHPTTNPDEGKSLSADNLITLTATITDKDGDTTNAVVNIGQNLTFKDDGPSISVNATAEPTLTVDETVLATNASADFSGNFTGAYGADGAGTLTYALGTAGGASGLVDTATNEAVNLVMNAGVLEGRTATSNALVFTVSVSASGVVTLDQIRAVVHPTTNPDEGKSLSADNLITLTATITDKDGDTTNAVVNIGQNLTFKDDGPSISVSVAAAADALTVDETNLAINATANFADNFSNSPSYGADGAGTVSSAYALSTAGGASGLFDVATGQSIVLVNNGGVIEGHVGTAAGALSFTVTVNASGVVTLDQILAIQHPVTTNPDDAVTMASGLITLTRTDTITDKDGDTNTGSNSISISNAISFKDDGPAFTLVNDGGDVGSIINVSAPNAAATYTTQLAEWTFGADGAQSGPTISSVTGNVAVNTSSAGSVVLDLKDASGTIVGKLTLNADGTDSLQVFNRAGTPQIDQLLTGDVTASGPSLTKTINSTISGLVVTVTAANNGVADLVNPSTQGWAVSDNQVDKNESITFSFSLPVDNFSFSVNGFTGSPSGGDVGLTIRVYTNLAQTTWQDFDADVVSGGTVEVNALSGFVSGTDIYGVRVLSNADQDNNDGFRINNVSVTAESTTPPPDLDYNFTLNVTDKDGDTVSQTIAVHLDGDTTTGGLVVEAIAGTSGADTLTGTAGNDALVGGAGNDLLTGGAGNDILTGGLGSDTFKFTGAVAANNADTVTDFTVAPVASGGDVLNLHDVLPVAAQGQTTAGALGAYLSVAADGLGNTVVKIDSDGAGANPSVTVVTLQGVTGVTLQDLLNNNQIVT